MWRDKYAFINTRNFQWGGGKIKDATALPEDVREGKIFYNNNGRQAGTGKMPKIEYIYANKVTRGTISYEADGNIRYYDDASMQSWDVGRILRTFKIKKNVEVTDNGKIII